MNITDICTRVDAQNERSRRVNSVFIRHFQVDEHTVIMTMSRRNFRKVLYDVPVDADQTN
jgi:hypothetical protein